MSATPLEPVPAIGSGRAYGVPRAAGVIDLYLDGNEGSSPPSAIRKTLEHVPIDVLRRYPDSSPLRSMLASRVGVSDDHVLVTAGGDDAIDRACRSMLCPGRELLIHTPTFEMFGRYASVAGGVVRSVPWLRGLFPANEFCDSITGATRLVALVTPNSPTGLTIAVDDIRRVAAAAPHALVVVDLAYTEFGERDITQELLKLPNVVVIRTLSKAWGLAGLRVGYAIGRPEVLEWMRAAGGPYTVAGPSIALATWAMTNIDPQPFIARVAGERIELAARLTRLGCEAWPSSGNFIFARFRDAAGVHVALAKRGIAVRAFPTTPSIADCLRITLPGEQHSFARLLDAIEAILNQDQGVNA